jgi:Flp pilus assembly protein TadB
MELTPIAVASALGVGLGLVGLLWSLAGPPPSDSSSNGAKTPPHSGEAIATRLTRRLLPALGIAILVLVITRWPVAGLLAGIAVAFAPAVIGRTSTERATDRIEAIAVWTELLRDTLAASAGLGGAIVATAPMAPPVIREPVMRLADRLDSAVPVPEALRAFATEVDDRSCDMVVCALLLAATSRAQRLADLLGALSESIRDEVAMRLRVEASRVSARSSVRTVIVFSLLFVAVLMMVARSYLAPFGTPLGQLMLAAVGGCYAAGIALMVRLVRPATPARLLGAAAVEREIP